MRDEKEYLSISGAKSDESLYSHRKVADDSFHLPRSDFGDNFYSLGREALARSELCNQHSGQVYQVVCAVLTLFRAIAFVPAILGYLLGPFE